MAQNSFVQLDGEQSVIKSFSKKVNVESGYYYEVNIAQSAINSPVFLLGYLSFELGTIKFYESEFESGYINDVNIGDNGYITAVYFGLGILLINSMYYQDINYSTFSNFPVEYMGFTLALYVWLYDNYSLFDEYPKMLNPFVKESYTYYLDRLENGNMIVSYPDILMLKE